MAAAVRIVTVNDYRNLLRDGAVPIDLRRPSDFVEGHVQGSRCLPYERFLLRQDLTLLLTQGPLLIIADGPTLVRDAMYEIEAAGNVLAGVLTGNAPHWASRGLDVLHWTRLTPENWLLHAGQPPLWEVRELSEPAEAGWPEGERHPLTELMTGPPPLDPASPVCLLGPYRRQVAAAMILYYHGARNLFYGDTTTPRVVANWGKAMAQPPAKVPEAASNQ